MANLLTSNPLRVDSAATIFSTPKKVSLIQWIDDNADIADDDDLLITINDVVITAKIQLTANTIGDVAVWTMGPFPKGLWVSNFVVTTIDHGALLIFIE
jgi:hypothetical protein